jgi:hypothetical protein
MSEHLKIEPAVMASEIERLPDLTGYLKVASVPDWMRVDLVPATYPVADIAGVTAPVSTTSPVAPSSTTAASQAPRRPRRRSQQE